MALHEVDALLETLARSSLRFVLVGGMAVGAHGFIRATADVDICPAPDPANLAKLAELIRELGATQLGEQEFAGEMPADPANPDDLANGGNFRLRTRLGGLDIMQWLPGIEAEHAFAELNANGFDLGYRGLTVRVCSLADLRRMKTAAGRPQDLVDLENLPH